MEREREEADDEVALPYEHRDRGLVGDVEGDRRSRCPPEHVARPRRLAIGDGHGDAAPLRELAHEGTADEARPKDEHALHAVRLTAAAWRSR